MNLNSDAILKKSGKEKLKWLTKAFNAMNEGRITQVTKVYEIMAAPGFVEKCHNIESKKMFTLIESNLHHFTPNQQKFLMSNKFEFHKRHAVISILSTDEEEDAAFKPVTKKEEAKPKWKIRAERRAQGLVSDSEDSEYAKH